MSKIHVSYLENFSTETIHSGGERVITEPPGGNAFSPTDFIAIGLASCILTLMAMKAKKLKIPFKNTSAFVEKKISESPRKIQSLFVLVESCLNPAESDRIELEKAAFECPVHVSLEPAIGQEIRFKWGVDR